MNNFTEKDKLLVYMSLLEISNKKQEMLISNLADFSIDKVISSPISLEILSREEYHKFVSGYDKLEFDSILNNLINSNIKILTVFSNDYPKRLIDLEDRPLILYAKGDLSLLNNVCLGIVGTRMPSNYGSLVTEKFASELAQSGVVIISGLCYGVDAIAHRKTLDVGGKTVAIIGSGFNNIYPATNTALAKEIAEKGLILSEYPPSFKPKRYTFPKRNRIIAGLSDGVLITEAAFKSGTIHTKEFALEYGKDIFAVPGNIYSKKSELTNMLIKSGQAECVLNPNDIIQFYGMDKNKAVKQVLSLSFDEQKIISILETGEKDFDYIAEKSKIPVNILNSCLTTLEINGLIRRLPGKKYFLLG